MPFTLPQMQERRCGLLAAPGWAAMHGPAEHCRPRKYRTRKRKPFVIPKLCVKDLHGFLALRPAIMPPALEDLAADCVRDFDKFRAPLDEDAVAKRLSAGLTDRQVALLRRWGYPYVLDEFRFHLTLTDTLTEEENETIKPVLSELFHRVIAEPIAVSAITIFVQPSECEPFTVLARYRFGR